MKLIKKIAAILFAFMMVVSMSCNVKAVEGASPETKGTITITNAKVGETYKLYKILSLESYSYTENEKDNGNYAYTLTGDDWDDFIKGSNVLNKYFKFDQTKKYLTWEGGTDEARVKEFAQLALKYARNEANGVQPVQPIKIANSNTVTYSGLDLGYYLVDSSVGSLCVLNTTNPDLTIAEKMVYLQWKKELAILKMELMEHQIMLALVIRYILKLQLLHNQELKTMCYMIK